MPQQSATASGADLSTVLTSALSDLVDDDVRVQAELPKGVELADLHVEVGASVTWDTDGAGATSDAAPIEESDVEESVVVPAPIASDDGAPADRDDQRRQDASPDDAVALTDAELDELDEEADAGADFIEGLLDAMDLPGELQIRIIEETRRAEVEVVDMDTGALIGRRGSTLEAIQELMRCALQSQFERRVHVHVDVEGYRARRLEKLLDKADEAIDQVLDAGEPERLEPMDVFERKAVHQFVNNVDGVMSRSQGREPSRRIVIEPSS